MQKIRAVEMFQEYKYLADGLTNDYVLAKKQFPHADLIILVKRIRMFVILAHFWLNIAREFEKRRQV